MFTMQAKFMRMISMLVVHSLLFPGGGASLALLRLTIHEGAQPRPVSEGLPFLGFSVYPQRRRLKRRKGIAYRRKLQALLLAFQLGEISLEEVSASVQGWVNHVRYGNTLGLRTAILGQTMISSVRQGS